MLQRVKDFAANPPALANPLIIWLASGFVLAPQPVWALLFYIGVIPLTLLHLWRRRPVRIDSIVAVAFAFITWSALTLVWGDTSSAGHVYKFFQEALCTFLFLAALLLALNESPRVSRSIGTVLIVGGALNAAFSIVRFLMSGVDLANRLAGWAETRQQVLGAMVIGVCYVLALGRWVEEKQHRALYGAACAVLFAFILLTFSRGPLVAASLATLILLSQLSGKRLLAVLGGTMLIAGTAVFFFSSTVARFYDLLTVRGTSYRLSIWRYTIDRIAERPLFGHGLAADFGMADIPFPHSLYFSALFYSGVVGFLLLALLLAMILWGVIRLRSAPERVVLLALWVDILIGSLTDVGQITKGPAPLWYIFWLPVGLSIAAIYWASRREAPTTPLS